MGPRCEAGRGCDDARPRILLRPRYDASIREVAMLQRGFMGAFDKKPDRVAFAKSSVASAASIGAGFAASEGPFGETSFGHM